MIKDKTTIQITKETHTKLISRGKKGETFEQIISKLLEEDT